MKFGEHFQIAVVCLGGVWCISKLLPVPDIYTYKFSHMNILSHWDHSHYFCLLAQLWHTSTKQVASQSRA